MLIVWSESTNNVRAMGRETLFWRAGYAVMYLFLSRSFSCIIVGGFRDKEILATNVHTMGKRCIWMELLLNSTYSCALRQHRKWCFV